MQQGLLGFIAARTTNQPEHFGTRRYYQELLMDNLEKFPQVSNILDEFEDKFINHCVDMPFKIDCDRLAYLHPKERIELRKISKKGSSFLYDEVPNENKLFFIKTIPNLFNQNFEVVTKPYFLEVVKRWLNLFLIHYEYGYFDVKNDMVSILQTAKAAMRTVNQVNHIKFVMFLYGWIRKFVKLVLYDLIDRFYADFETHLGKVEKIFDGMFPHPGQEKKLSFGRFYCNIRKLNRLFKGIQQTKI